MPETIRKAAAATLGCKVNFYDTEAMLELLRNDGYEIVDFSMPADVYIVNTCTVTNLGDKKSRQLIRKAKKQNPDSIVVVAGCYAQVASEEIKKIEGVNIIIGTKNRADIVEAVNNYAFENGISDIVADISEEKIFEPLSVESLDDRQRAYIKIQEGCDRFCSYCIIPYARGPVRSRRLEDIIKEVGILSENGYKEIVLAGIHVASYGKDLSNTNLLAVLKKVSENCGIKRIRTSSLEPVLFDSEFVNEISKLPKLCDHFHLSLQSGCDKILKAMNRRYTKTQYRQSVDNIRQAFPNAGLTTDIIVGFPGETEEDFLQTLEFTKEIGFSKIHVFPYSPKAGTKAAEMDNQVSNSIKETRAGILINAGNVLSEIFLKRQLGKELSVLFERSAGKDLYEGYTTNYIKIVKKSKTDLKNKIEDVTIKRVENYVCYDF